MNVIERGQLLDKEYRSTDPIPGNLFLPYGRTSSIFCYASTAGTLRVSYVDTKGRELLIKQQGVIANDLLWVPILGPVPRLATSFTPDDATPGQVLIDGASEVK